jgi:agmatinase
MAQFLHLIDAVLASGRKIIGADLVEVVPGQNQWDANVGARVLYALSHRLS